MRNASPERYILKITDSWSSAGSADQLTEDSWGAAQFGDIKILWLIDGCTDLDRERSRSIYPGGTSSAYWHKEVLSHILASYPYISMRQDPRQYIAQIVTAVRTTYDALRPEYDMEDWALPSSTLVWVALSPSDNLLRVMWIGDSVCVVRKNGRPETVMFPNQTGRLGVLAETKKADIRAGRAAHIQDGDLSLSIFPERLAGLHSVDLGASSCRAIILASDGFWRLVDIFGACDPRDLFDHARKYGLSGLGERLRTLERQIGSAVGAAGGKLHDDATAVLSLVEPSEADRHEFGIF